MATSVPNSSPPPALDYGPRPPIYRRRRARQWIALALLLIAAGIVWLWWGSLRNTVLSFYWERRCLAYTAPADQVAYDELPRAVGARLPPDCSQFANPYPGGAFSGSGPPAVGRLPDELIRWRASSPGTPLVTPIGQLGEAVVFLHELQSKTGIRRLVLIEKRPSDTRPLFEPFDLEYFLFGPGKFRVIPLPPSEYLSPLAPRRRLRPVRLQLFAGQVDPTDAAHFTIRYAMDIDGSERVVTSGGAAPPSTANVAMSVPLIERQEARGSGIIDGRLSEDGIEVLLTVRDGPAAPPSPWGMPQIRLHEPAS